MAESSRTGVNSVLIAFKILEVIAQTRDIGVSELARRLGMPKSTTHRYLTTLGSVGWLEVVDRGQPRWKLGTQAVSLGLRAADGLRLRDVILPIMSQLREATGETVLLSVPDERAALLVERLDSLKALRPFIRLGELMPYHASAAGLALLAGFPRDHAEGILSQISDDSYTSNTILDRTELRNELDAIRQRNYSINLERWTDGISGVGSAITDAHGNPVAAVSIAVPSVRLNDQSKASDLGLQLVESTQQIQGLLRS